MTNTQDPNPPKTPATPARQGRLGKPVLAVLLVSITLAFAGLLATWLLRSDDLADTEAHNARQAADAQVFDQPAPAPRIANENDLETGAPLPDQVEEP